MLYRAGSGDKANNARSRESSASSEQTRDRAIPGDEHIPVFMFHLHYLLDHCFPTCMIYWWLLFLEQIINVLLTHNMHATGTCQRMQEFAITDDGANYAIVMEYVDGGDLLTYVQESRARMGKEEYQVGTIMYGMQMTSHMTHITAQPSSNHIFIKV